MKAAMFDLDRIGWDVALACARAGDPSELARLLRDATGHAEIPAAVREDLASLAEGRRRAYARRGPKSLTFRQRTQAALVLAMLQIERSALRAGGRKLLRERWALRDPLAYTAKRFGVSPRSLSRLKTPQITAKARKR
jgi:hypothetical protein